MSDSPRFRTVMRGYEPTQVDQRLAEQEQALHALRAELEQHRAGAGDQQASCSSSCARSATRPGPRSARSRAEPQAPTFEDLGSRIAQILGLARDEAEEMRGSATEEVSVLRLDAETQAAAVREEADRYATDTRSAADVQAARMIENVQRQVDELLDGADREASARREEAEALYEQQRAAAAAAAADFETTLAERRQRAEADFTAQSTSSDAQLRDAQDRTESARAEAERVSVEAQRDADQLLADARQQADDLIASAKGRADRVRLDSERELAAATARRDSINAQLANVRQMLATLSGAAPAALALQVPDVEATPARAGPGRRADQHRRPHGGRRRVGRVGGVDDDGDRRRDRRGPTRDRRDRDGRGHDRRRRRRGRDRATPSRSAASAADPRPTCCPADRARMTQERTPPLAEVLARGGWALLDPRPTAAAHPDTFEMPTAAELAAVRPGHQVRAMFAVADLADEVRDGLAPVRRRRTAAARGRGRADVVDRAVHRPRRRDDCGAGWATCRCPRTAGCCPARCSTCR